MAVYVDSLALCVTTPAWPWGRACHLFADTDAELHDFAASISLKRAWFQDRRDFPHYDLTSGKRKEAVRAGAREATREDVVRRMEA